MSSLDQAFIKAYQGQGGCSAKGAAEGAKSVPLADAFSEPVEGREESSEPAIVPLDTVLETLAAPPPPAGRPEDGTDVSQAQGSHTSSQAATGPSDPGRQAAGDARSGKSLSAATRPALLRIWAEEPQPEEAEKPSRGDRAPQLEDLDLPAVVPLPGIEAASAAEAGHSSEEDVSCESEQQETREPITTTRPEAATAPTQSAEPSEPQEHSFPGDAQGDAGPQAEPRADEGAVRAERQSSEVHSAPAFDAQQLHPRLQVDYFHWPRLCRRLAGAAGEQLEQLARWLEKLQSEGRKVVAFGGHQRGEGATSLLLAVGRRLAARGLRVVLADADFSRPQLAARLGLLPQVGWEAVLAGRAELAEALIESVEDRLILLPVREAFAGAGLPLGHEAEVGRSLEQLAAAVDLVLVDLGPLKEQAVVEGVLLRAMGGRLSGVVLVENVAATAAQRLREIETQLTRIGVPLAGVVENLARTA